ncbi:hypothetical protein ABVK25_012304 [Lepraria finkii]|uniref:Lysine-specific metallo-endopeptidase domain-containing protein n=1 Tax=Lepraria finkii TaxID=1340010 RepID=A0ABR4AGI3_9LECA
MLARWKSGAWIHGLFRLLMIVSLSTLTCAQIVQYCDQHGIQGIQAAIDEAISLAQNAVLSYAQPSVRVQALLYALIKNPNFYLPAVGNLQRVANYLSAPPRISIYCGDDFIAQGPDGQWYESSDPNNPTLLVGGFIPCSGSASRGYVLRSQTAPLIILCPFGLTFRMQIGEISRHVPQINVPLDNAVGVSATILHEFLHIANPNVRDQSHVPTPEQVAKYGPAPNEEYAAYGWASCVRLALTRGGAVAANNADTLMLLAVGLYFTNTQFAYGVGTLTSDALLLPQQPNWQMVAVTNFPSLFHGNRQRKRFRGRPKDLDLLNANVYTIGEKSSG